MRISDWSSDVCSSDLRRRELLGGATLAAAWAAGGVDIANDALAASAPAGKIPGVDPERNKRLLRERRADAQMHALPCSLPNEAGKFDRAAQSPLVCFTPKSVIVSNDSPITPTTTAEERQLIQGGFASQALGPTFISYGPMLAEGNTVIEEW